ncbi:hypothetical protein ACFL0D_08360 [Thermoproteota archaeon]
MESHLHLAMKDAVIRDLVDDGRYSTEYLYGYRGSGALRVDISYTKNKREYLVECETRPNIKRLIDKGKRRNEISYRTMYILVVPSEYYHRIDWRQLHGYFDIIFTYEIDRDMLTERQDLRFLGSLRDVFLNVLVPVYKSNETQSVSRWLVIRKNLLVYELRGYLHCTACKLDIPTPWIFCPRDDCPNSVYGYN